MKMSQFRKLIREEIQAVLREAADPIEKVYGRLYGIGERYGIEDDLLNALDEYLESEGVWDIYSKWLEREDTGAILSTSEAAKLLKPMAEFLEGSKAPMANQKRVYKTIIKIYNALPFYKNNSYDAIIDPLIYKQLSPESAKLFQPIIASGRDGVFGTKKQIDTLVRELETINVNKLVQDYEKLPAAAKLPKN
jgi:hypothetical protein